MSSLNKRTSLTALQKKELCLAKQIAPYPTNVDLSNIFNIGKSTVSEILKDKKKWLEIDDDSHEAKKKKQRNLIEQIKNITSQYQLSDIFNADETGLFWQLEPSRVLSTGQLFGIGHGVTKPHWHIGLSNMPTLSSMKILIRKIIQFL
ncbi:572_t:CDS:2 [Entrophospora sp. SA101]|nr:572_t:CDS:2 [Entrophospora sp. SA101]